MKIIDLVLEVDSDSILFEYPMRKYGLGGRGHNKEAFTAFKCFLFIP